MKQAELTEPIIGASYDVWNELGFGFLEAVYEKSLLIALRDRRVQVESQVPVSVSFRGEVVGSYVVDLLVGKDVIVELKSIQQLAAAHEVQLVNYLKATGIPIGLLINFGPRGVDVKRKHRDPRH
ncbi:MAG: GxxExxY protein [Planctomycetota bacterium]